jgi:hypothetical protein
MMKFRLVLPGVGQSFSQGILERLAAKILADDLALPIQGHAVDHRDEQGNELFHSSLFNTVSGAELRPNDSGSGTDAGCAHDIRIS